MGTVNQYALMQWSSSQKYMNINYFLSYIAFSITKRYRKRSKTHRTGNVINCSSWVVGDYPISAVCGGMFIEAWTFIILESGGQTWRKGGLLKQAQYTVRAARLAITTLYWLLGLNLW